ncbi:hypothetical protein C5167_025803 [Papaver somniferum]|uniref:Uncharacterized protein n=1 Tax=Papaver somniferum TaxID=3469 RepID=A0A4Y7JTN4_PAPSO|nr:hypothetical protein C5167_025803 [Papaver somniferum]
MASMKFKLAEIGHLLGVLMKTLDEECGKVEKSYGSMDKLILNAADFQEFEAILKGKRTSFFEIVLEGEHDDQRKEEVEEDDDESNPFKRPKVFYQFIWMGIKQIPGVYCTLKYVKGVELIKGLTAPTTGKSKIPQVTEEIVLSVPNSFITCSCILSSAYYSLEDCNREQLASECVEWSLVSPGTSLAMSRQMYPRMIADSTIGFRHLCLVVNLNLNSGVPFKDYHAAWISGAGEIKGARACRDKVACLNKAETLNLMYCKELCGLKILFAWTEIAEEY